MLTFAQEVCMPDIERMAKRIAREWKDDEIFELIKHIDLIVGDCQFTKTMHDYFDRAVTYDCSEVEEG